MTNHVRGSGRTTAQMRDAKRGSLYVVPNNAFIVYAQALAKHIGREDLVFTSPDALKHYRGRVFNGAVIDHAASLSAEQDQQFNYILIASRSI
jgi:hypothetical protein